MNDITPDPTGEGSAWQPVTPAPGSGAEHPAEVCVSGPHMAPDGIGGWVLKNGPYMSIPLPASPPVSPAPADQLKQLPEPCIPCCLNQGLTEAARRIVDLEEERDALKARVEQLTTDLQTAKEALQEWMEEHKLTEEAGGIVERLNQEADGYRAQIAALTARAALSATDEGRLG